jgi:hypothetical protein
MEPLRSQKPFRHHSVRPGFGRARGAGLAINRRIRRIRRIRLEMPRKCFVPRGTKLERGRFDNDRLQLLFGRDRDRASTAPIAFFVFITTVP